MVQSSAGHVLLALGANLPGRWGDPLQPHYAVYWCELAKAGLRLMAASHIYATAPLGPGRQAPYLNAV